MPHPTRNHHTQQEVVARGRAGVTLDPQAHPVVTAETAFAHLGIDRNTGYRAIREGTFPVPVVRIGRIIRVPTIGLCRLLLLEPTPEIAPASPAREDEV